VRERRGGGLVVHLLVAAFDHLGDVLQHLRVLVERLEVRDLTAQVTERESHERESEDVCCYCFSEGE
jgi:hypothetical protein